MLVTQSRKPHVVLVYSQTAGASSHYSFSSVPLRQLHPRSPITLPIALDKMIFDSQRLIQRFFARAQARRDAFNHPVERAVVEKGTAVPVFAAQGADDSVHG